MGFVQLVENLIFPPKCANCGELLGIELAKKQVDALCKDCRAQLESEKAIECQRCGLQMQFCRCMPRKMEKAQCAALLKLVLYRPSDDKMKIKPLIYSIKHSRNRASFRFAAEQMRGLLIPEMRAYSLAPADCVITYMPRSHKNKAQDGFDQGLEMAKELSLITGIALVHCFKRKIHSKQQRDLNRFERQLNMSSAYSLLDIKDAVKDKTVILVDDIVTTGSSMAACARLLYSAGAYSVLGVSLGVTEKKQKNKAQKD